MSTDSKSPSVEEYLKLAKEDLARSSLTSAERSLEQAILINNQVPEAFHLLGHVYAKRGKFKKAILAFQRTLALDPFHTEAAIALSSLHNDVGNYKEGANVFLKTKKRLERAAPGFDPRINQELAGRHQETGLLYMRFERFAEAYQEFAKAQQLEPDNVTAAVQMAKCLSKTGEKERAIQVIRKLLETQPKSVEAKLQLGILLHSQRKLHEAYREWQEALALDPENRSAQMYLSMFEYEPPASSPKSPLDVPLSH